MQAREEAGAGLTRPELAVLLAGAKRNLAARLLTSTVPDQPALRAALAGYFPPLLVERFGHHLDGHRLRRELVASVVANDVVNRMGATFVTRLAADTGATPAEVAAAYWIARTVVCAPERWAELEAGEDGLPPTAQVLAAGPVLSDLLEALTRDYLRRQETDDIAATAARDQPALAELAGAVADLGTPYRRRLRARRAETLADRGLDADMALRWAGLPDLEVGPDAAELARATGRAVPAVAEAVLQLGESLGIDRLGERLRQATPAGPLGPGRVAGTGRRPRPPAPPRRPPGARGPPRRRRRPRRCCGSSSSGLTPWGRSPGSSGTSRAKPSRPSTPWPWPPGAVRAAQSAEAAVGSATVAGAALTRSAMLPELGEGETYWPRPMPAALRTRGSTLAARHAS